jgi:ankyrin repeat protein
MYTVALVSNIDTDSMNSASAYGHYDIVQLLIQSGGDPNLKNSKGWTAVDYAFSVDMAVYLKRISFFNSTIRMH